MPELAAGTAVAIAVATFGGIALGSADIDDSASLPMKTGGAAAESSGDESCELPSGESGSWATGDVARDEAGVMRG